MKSVRKLNEKLILEISLKIDNFRKKYLLELEIKMFKSVVLLCDLRNFYSKKSWGPSLFFFKY